MVLRGRVGRDQRRDEAGGVVVEQGDGLVDVGDDHQADLRRFLPLPFGPELLESDELSAGLAHSTLGAGDVGRLEPLGGDVRLAARGDVQLGVGATPVGRCAERRQHHRHELVGAVGDDAADVERVAHLAVE